jgi:phage-related protein
MQPILKVSFYTNGNAEPVRDWLKSLNGVDKKAIGEDIKTVQYGWPLGMPLVGHIDGDIWEVRIKLDNRIARVLFCLEQSNMVLLHGFIKKTQKTPDSEIDIAKDRLKKLKGKK